MFAVGFSMADHSAADAPVQEARHLCPDGTFAARHLCLENGAGPEVPDFVINPALMIKGSDLSNPAEEVVSRSVPDQQPEEHHHHHHHHSHHGRPYGAYGGYGGNGGFGGYGGYGGYYGGRWQRNFEINTDEDPDEKKNDKDVNTNVSTNVDTSEKDENDENMPINFGMIEEITDEDEFMARQFYRPYGGGWGRPYGGGWGRPYGGGWGRPYGGGWGRPYGGGFRPYRPWSNGK